jgi:nicotinate-nucleotide adenylyltransferase
MNETGHSPSAAPRVAMEGERRVAFFGGSFDPPHNGHLAVARAARTALALDGVLFAPVGAQPLKGQGATASFEDRVAMTRLAIAGEPGFEISLADAPSATGTPNFSVDTLERVRAELGVGLGGGCRLFFLMGADAFFGLRQWHRAAEVPLAAELVVASRPGQPLDDLAAALPQGLTLEPWPEGDAVRGGVAVRGFRVKNARGEGAALYLLPGLDEDASASEIRDQIKIRERSGAGKNASPLREWLPDAVAEYVRAHGLYR